MKLLKWTSLALLTLSIPTFAQTTLERPFGLSSSVVENKKSVLDLMLYGEGSHMKTDRDFIGDYQDFFESGKKPIVQIFEMEKFKSGKVKEDVWSSSFWPLVKGGIAHRYRGGGSGSFLFSHNYSRRQWPPTPNSSQDLDRLSPSEKYDMLVGDNTYSLTAFEWKRGLIQDQTGSRVQSWEGYCHGWAMAATREKRPVKAVKVKAPNGKMLTFYPDDIKALASSMWANAMSNAQGDRYHYAGSKCRQSYVRTNAWGRARSSSCFDVNPGIFHTIAVNLIGRNGESFIFDSSADSEVWNFPVTGYKLRYFNPQSGRRYKDESLSSAVIKIEDYSRDRYKDYRSPRTRYVVGVAIDLNYMRLRSPSRSAVDNRRADKTGTHTYYYDLELDSEYKIIGGEWHQRKHPDILWRPKPSLVAGIPADEFLNAENFDLKTGSLPAEFSSEVGKSSAKGIASGKIIRRLIEMSQ